MPKKIGGWFFWMVIFLFTHYKMAVLGEFLVGDLHPRECIKMVLTDMTHFFHREKTPKIGVKYWHFVWVFRSDMFNVSWGGKGFQCQQFPQVLPCLDDMYW